MIRVLAIRLQKYNQGWKDWHDRPFLFHVDMDDKPLFHPDRKFYHGVSGPSYQTVPAEHACVEKDYGTFDFDDYDTLDAVHVQFSQDWPPDRIKYGDPIPEDGPQLGYIASDGSFYPCPYGSHLSLGECLCRAKLGKVGDSADLLRAGWVQVNRGGVDLPDDERVVTERQKTILDVLYSRADETGHALSMRDVSYKRTLRWALEQLGMIESSVGELVVPGRRWREKHEQ